MKIGRVLSAVLAFGLGLSGGGLEAQTWPTRTVTLIVPFAPGGATDAVARIVAQGMSQQLGQTVVVENVGGVGGTLGTAKLKTASPDGYTIGLGHFGTHAAAVALYRKLPYDPIADFDPIGWIASSPVILTARKDFPAATLPEFIAFARSQGDKITNGHAGVGSTAHVSCAFFSALAGITPTEIPYKGNGPMTNDLLAGRIDYACEQLSGVIPRIRSGQVKAFAIAMPQRSPAVPEVPTSAEGGLPGFQADAWAGLFAPKGVPEAAMARLRSAVFAALDEPQVRERLEGLGAVMPTAQQRQPEPFAAFVRSEIERWGKIIRDANIPYSE